MHFMHYDFARSMNRWMIFENKIIGNWKLRILKICFCVYFKIWLTIGMLLILQIILCNLIIFFYFYCNCKHLFVLNIIINFILITLSCFELSTLRYCAKFDFRLLSQRRSMVLYILNIKQDKFALLIWTSFCLIVVNILYSVTRWIYSLHILHF